MGKADSFRRYAEEAMTAARSAEDERELLGLIELAVVWKMAASLERPLPQVIADADLSVPVRALRKFSRRI